MKKTWFKLLIFPVLIAFSSCGGPGICNCKDACTVSGEGQISCSLDEKALEKRKDLFYKKIGSKAEIIEETPNGFRFKFKDEGNLNKQLFNFILTEKKCCPFFQYDLVILPYNEGIHLTVSGSKEVKAFLKSII